MSAGVCTSPHGPRPRRGRAPRAGRGAGLGRSAARTPKGPSLAQTVTDRGRSPQPRAEAGVPGVGRRTSARPLAAAVGTGSPVGRKPASHILRRNFAPRNSKIGRTASDWATAKFHLRFDEFSGIPACRHGWMVSGDRKKPPRLRLAAPSRALPLRAMRGAVLARIRPCSSARERRGTSHGTIARPATPTGAVLCRISNESAPPQTRWSVV